MSIDKSSSGNNNDNNNDDECKKTAVMLIDQPSYSSKTSSPTRPTAKKHDMYSIISLPEPSTCLPRDYLLLSNTSKAYSIYEIQNLSAPISTSTTAPKTCEKQMFTNTYNSFMVQSNIVQNKSLHVANRVDPLYFVLSIFMERRRKGQKKSQWQPLEQIMEKVPVVLQRALRSSPAMTCDETAASANKVTPEKMEETPEKSKEYSQLSHLFQVSDQFDDDILFYKFDLNKAISWLVSKFDKIVNILRKQSLESKKRKRAMEERLKKSGKGSGGDGAFSSQFHLPTEGEDDKVEKKTVEKEEDDNVPTKLALTTEEVNSIRVTALQFLSEYLSEECILSLKQELKLEDVGMAKGKKKQNAVNKKEKKNVGTSSAVLVDTDDEGEQSNNDANTNSRKRIRENDDDNNDDDDNDDENIQTTKPTTSSSSSWGALPGEEDRDKLLQYTMGCGGGNSMVDDEEEDKKKKINKAQSFGLKKLAKVNTKGMKSIASFFGGAGAGAKKKRKVS